VVCAYGKLKRPSSLQVRVAVCAACPHVGGQSVILSASDDADVQVIMMNDRAFAPAAVFYGQPALLTWEITDT